MEIYIDSANLKEIKEAIKTGLISGVTTNPSLIAKEGKNFEDTLKEIDSYFSKIDQEFECTISAEIDDTKSKKEMITQAVDLAKISPRIIIKIPISNKGLQVVQELYDKGIRTNVTLIFSLSQAILSAKAGAWCVSPFIGRLDDHNLDGIQLVEEIVDTFNYYDFETKVLSASIRNIKAIEQSILVGADIVTTPYKLFNQMFEHELTTQGMDKFNKDLKLYQKMNKSKKSKKSNISKK